MTRKNASKETIALLIKNARSSILDYEELLKNTELIKARISTFEEAVYLQLILELLSGSLLALYEVCSDLKNMLSTDSLYVKRFHMQMINLSQYEWCKYLVGRDQGGVIPKLINQIKEFNKETIELESILQQLILLGKNCDAGLRNITAHYDNPNTMYSKLISLNDEDVYAKRIGDQLLIHDMIFKYVFPVLQTITEALCANKQESTFIKSVASNTIIDVINEKIAEAFHAKEELNFLVTDQIANAWENIESHKKNYTVCEKAIEYFTDKQADCTRFSEIRALEELRWEASFMQYDLVCSINTYLKADSNAERSISFMRAYRIKTGALSHLYGYNEIYNEKSIWKKIKAVPEFSSIPQSNEIEDELIALTTNFDPTKRNLYTHYREDVKLNISARWKCANEMNHVKELMQMLRLVILYKKINHFLHSLIKAMSLSEKQKIDEMLKPILKIKELSSKYNYPDKVELYDKLLDWLS